MIPVFDSILFDFDGVLADTEPIHWACWVDVLQPLHIVLTWDVYRANCVGVADIDMLGFLASLAPQPIPVDSLLPRYAAKNELFRRRVADASPCPPETVELIGMLGAYRLAVVTSSGREEVEPVLVRAGIRPHFAAAVFAEDVALHKPAPDPYLLAARRLAAKRPLVVEDSDAGVASARSAGFEIARVAIPQDVARVVKTRIEERE